MGAVGRGVAGLVVRQVGGVDLVEGHVHRLRPVPDGRAHRVAPQEIHRALPDQDAHAARTLVGGEELAQPADVRHVAQRRQGRALQVEDEEEEDADDGLDHPAQPEPAQATPGDSPAGVGRQRPHGEAEECEGAGSAPRRPWRGGRRRRSAAGSAHQAEQHEDVQAGEEAQPRAAALGEEDRQELRRQHGHVGAGQERVGQVAPLLVHHAA